MGKSKSPAPVEAPKPALTPIQQKPAEPIQRNATSAEARDRADKNASANLLTETSPIDETQANRASMMG